MTKRPPVTSPSGHRLGALTAEQNTALATTPADSLFRCSSRTG